MASNNEAELQAWVDERMMTLSSEAEWRPNAARALSKFRRCVLHDAYRLRRRRLLEDRAGRGKPRPYKRILDLDTLASWSPVWAWSVAAIAAAVVLLMMVSPSPRVLAQRCVDCSIALWHGLSATSAPAPPAELMPEIARKPAIDFKLENTNGNMVRLFSYKGRVVLLNFWATWCGGCKTEMPWFVELQEQFRDRGLSAIGVSMDEDGMKSVGPYLAKHPVNYTIVAGSAGLGRQYQVEAMPVTMLLDRNGRIAVRHVGLVTKAQYQSELEALLAEKAGNE
jgi:peroxiredoxin